MKPLISVTLTMVIVCCSNIPDDVTYKIASEEVTEAASKTVLHVELNKRVTLEILKEIGQEIKQSRSEYERVWIFYTVPDMPETASGMSWAISHYTPGPEIEILEGKYY